MPVLRVPVLHMIGPALVAGGLLALAQLLARWVPAGPDELWPVRLADLGSAPLGAALVVAAAVALALLARRLGPSYPSYSAGAVGALVLAALTLGWPHVESARSLVDRAAREPLHALACTLAAAVAAAYVVRRSAPAGAPARPRSARAELLAGGALLVGALAASWAARGVATRELPELEGRRVVTSLLHEPDWREVVRENPDRPVRVTSFAAHTVTQFDAGNLPVLELTPPAEVRIELPPSEPGAVLELAAGVAAEAYVSEGKTRVTLEAELDGERVLDAQLTTWKNASARRRSWQRAELDVARGGTLVLRSAWQGPPEEVPRAGFGLLEVTAPVRGRRTLATRRAPNAILIVIDTLRADRLSAYGNPRPASPALDALAARGTLFEAAYSAASWTWPSTASVLTALTPPEHGVTDSASCYLSDGLTTLAEAFQEAGFTTAAFSSNPLISADKNFDGGFESFREYRWADARTVLADAEAWLHEHGRYRFFLYLHLIDPHGPYEPEPDLRDRFGAPEPEGYSEARQKELVDRLRAAQDVDAAELERMGHYLSSLYDGEVATADRALGELFALLARLGLDDRTLIAVTSDHGEEFLEHGMLGHGRQLFDESVRVPLIVAGPGVPRGARERTPVENRFVGPTLLRLAGVDAPGNLRGRPDLLDAGDVEQVAREPIFFSSELGWWPGEGSRSLRAVLDPPWLLVQAPERDGESERLALFDLAGDPRAERDLAGELPAEADRLAGAIEAWWRESEQRRPTVFDGGAEVRDMLLDLGYIGGEEATEHDGPDR